MAGGADFQALLMRPNMTPEDGAAIERDAPSIAMVDVTLGDGGPPTQERVYYKNLKSKQISVLGTTERWTDVTRLPLEEGRFFTSGEVQRRRHVIVLGQTPAQALFTTGDPVGKTVRLGLQEYEVVGVVAKRPSPGGFNLGVDDFVVIPQTTYQKQFGVRAFNMGLSLIHISEPTRPY